MTLFLTFTLVAPLASFGGIAVGERRTGGDRPAKSSILGLVAGALGLERDNAAHARLVRELFYAVRSEDMQVCSPRRLMTDYHTVQTPARGRNQHFATRREEVADKQSLGTILSYREYRSDCAFTVALWTRVISPRFSLEELAEALLRPVFTPYIGRKACPLMLPTNPRIIPADDVHQAFVQYDAMLQSKRVFLEKYGLTTTPRMLAIDTDAARNMEGRRERRRDEVLARERWQFGLREEFVSSWERGTT